MLPNRQQMRATNLRFHTVIVAGRPVIWTCSLAVDPAEAMPPSRALDGNLRDSCPL